MKLKLTLLISIISLSISAQTVYEVQGFSDTYYGKVSIDNNQESEYFITGTVTIFNSKTNKEVIKVRSESLSLDFDEKGKIKANIKEIPYGEQSVVISEDFNFDGKKDIAIMDGSYSCYGGPSFQIYLDKENTLIHSPEFTRLGQEYCGMFQINQETKTIFTSTKSGCCWHQYSEFKVQNNKPIAIKIIEEGFGKEGITMDYLESTRVGTKMVEESYSYFLEDADIKELYSLDFKNGKQMKLYSVFDNQNLLYAFIDKEEIIELMYYDDFIYNTKDQTLTFNNTNVTYQIYSGGIRVSLPKKEVDIKAIKTGKSLSILSDLSVNNLEIE